MNTAGLNPTTGITINTHATLDERAHLRPVVGGGAVAVFSQRGGSQFIVHKGAPQRDATLLLLLLCVVSVCTRA